jgi:hypothetical protein
MNTRCLLLALFSGVLSAQAPLRAQSEFYVTFRGTCYQTNSSGDFVATPISEQTWLQQAAEAGGVTNLKTLALVYHVNGSSFGDTIDVVNPTNGVAYTSLFGFFFGDQLGRTALTNSPPNEMRRVDYIYTQQSPYALGGSFLTKRYVTDGSGNVFTTIDAEIEYLVRPDANNPAKICFGSFTTTTDFVPVP